MKVGIPKESSSGETRVAIIPAGAATLTKAGLQVVVESGAGLAAGFTDAAYAAQNATIASRAETLASDIILQVRAIPPANGLHAGQTVIGFADPLGSPQAVRDVAASGAAILSMELMPRITRAQSMDALSSMATIAGYKGVLLAANQLPRMFPMLMTAAGTVSPARVFIVGAGVAGLQAISAARRLGAKVEAYDVRPAVKEQVQSLGARFVELPLESADAEDKGGYAKELGEDFYRKQRELMAKQVAESDVVITTAAIPGKKSPVLITGDMLKGMPPGSVVVDLAAERGGNVDVTRAGETIEVHGVTVIGPLNIPSAVPYHSSQMYARNVMAFVQNFVAKGEINLSLEDEINRDTMVAKDGEVVGARVREALGMSKPAAAATA